MKLGILGYRVNTGIGNIMQDYHRNLPVVSQFVINHGRYGIDKRIQAGLYVEDEALFEDWLSTISTLLFMETPFKPDYLRRAKDMGIRTVCVVNVEWFSPNADWFRFCDVFICPNHYTYKTVSRAVPADRCCMIPACVDTDLVGFARRGVLTRFLFNNGRGGIRGHKGLAYILYIFMSTPERVIINTQTPIPDINGFEVNCRDADDRTSLFVEGQAYLALSRWEGYGLAILEAMAAGYPTITFDFPPMSEYAPISELLAPCGREKVSLFGNNIYRPVPDIPSLRSLLGRLYGKDMSEYSVRTREFIEKKHSWKAQRDKYLSVLDS